MNRESFYVWHCNSLVDFCCRATLIVACLLFFAAFAHAGAAPMTDKAVPVFPGAKPDKEAEAVMSEEPDGGADSVTGVNILRSSYRKGYGTTATPEEVFEYYRKKLSAIEREDDEYEDPASGSATKVTYDIDFHQIDGDPYDGCLYNCEEYAWETKAKWKKIRGLLSKHRKPYVSEKWLWRAFFSWGVKEPNGDDTYFEVSVRDASIDLFLENPSYSPKTFIYVRRDTQKSQEAFDREVEEEGWRQHEKEHEKKTKALAAGKAPKPEDLGVPSYPGAKYESEATSFMRETLAIDCAAYITNDSVKQVAEFYKDKNGLELAGDMTREGALLKRCKKEYNRFLNQTMSTGNCDLEITVQNPWQAKSGGKKNKSTLITFVRGEQVIVDDSQVDDALWEETGEWGREEPGESP